MSKRTDYSLTQEQLVELERAIKSSPDPEVRQRATAIRMLHLGQPPEQVAHAVMVSRNTINAWHKRWREQGIAGLRNRQRINRPTKAEPVSLNGKERAAGLGRRSLDLLFTSGTLNRLQLYVTEQSGVFRDRASMSREGQRWKAREHDLKHLQARPAQGTAALALELGGFRRYIRGENKQPFANKKVSSNNGNSPAEKDIEKAPSRSGNGRAEGDVFSGAGVTPPSRPVMATSRTSVVQGPALPGLFRESARRKVATARQDDWGLLPPLLLVSGGGILVMAVASILSRFGSEIAPLLFWLSVLILFVPATLRLFSPTLSRRESIGLVLVLGVGLYVGAVLINRPTFVNYDEMLHWRTANDILVSNHLFTENTMLPVSPFFPGLEIVTVMLVKLTGISISAAAILLLGLARVLLVLALYLVFEHISGSTRITGLATALYMTNANFFFFNPQFAYEGLATPLMLIGLLVILIRGFERGRTRSTFFIMMVIFAAAITTHHLTMYLLSTFLVLWIAIHYVWKYLYKRTSRWDPGPMLEKGVPPLAGIVRWLRSRSQDDAAGEQRQIQGGRKDPLVATIFIIAACAFYVFVLATPTINYLGGAVIPGIRKIILMIAGELQARTLFTDGAGYMAPRWEQVCSITAILLTCLGLVLGLYYVWRRFRNDSLVMPRAVAARAFPFTLQPRLNDSLLLATAVAASAFPVTLLLRLNDDTWEISARLSAFLAIAVAYVLAEGAVGFHSRHIPAWLKYIIVGVTATVIFAGGITSGSPPWSRLPGPYLVSADPRSVEAQGLTTADWARETLGENNRFAGDRINSVIMGSFGMQTMVFKEDREGERVTAVFFAPTLDDHVKQVIRTGNIHYLIADYRLTTMRPYLSYYFEAGEPIPPGPSHIFEERAFDKFDGVPEINRVFDNGNIVIYDTTRLTDVP